MAWDNRPRLLKGARFMRKEEGGSGMCQTGWIRSISVVALVLALAACQQEAQTPTGGTVMKPEATKIGEVSDLVGPSFQCASPDGQKDQGIRLKIPPELGAKVSYLELLASGEINGKWASCAASEAGAWSLETTEEGSDKPMQDLSKGGSFVIHAADNGAFKQSTLELIGKEKSGQEVFRVTVSG